MRVLISGSSSFLLSRRAVERARELDAGWAFPDHMPLVGEPQHHAHGEYDANRWEDEYWLPDEVPRHDPVLLQLYDELGAAMSWGDDGYQPLRCLEIADDVTYYVGSYTGEWIAEQHRVWSEPGDCPEGRPAGTPAFVFTKDSVWCPLTLDSPQEEM